MKGKTTSDRMHSHKCEKCGTVWEHWDSCRDLPDEELDAAHACPRCGKEQSIKYHGTKEAEFTNHHEGGDLGRTV